MRYRARRPEPVEAFQYRGSHPELRDWLISIGSNPYDAPAMAADDWLVRDIRGAFHVYSPEIFAATFELV